MECFKVFKKNWINFRNKPPHSKWFKFRVFNHFTTISRNSRKKLLIPKNFLSHLRNQITWVMYLPGIRNSSYQFRTWSLWPNRNLDLDMTITLVFNEQSEQRTAKISKFDEQPEQRTNRTPHYVRTVRTVNKPNSSFCWTPNVRIFFRKQYQNRPLWPQSSVFCQFDILKGRVLSIQPVISGFLKMKF